MGAASAFTLVACGFGDADDPGADDEPATVTTAPGPTVPPGRTYTAEQLGPALPAPAELPAGFEPRYFCVDEPFPGCAVQPGATEAFVQYQRGTGFATTTLSMTASAQDDGTDAAEELTDRRDRADETSGTISESIQPQGEAVYSPGREGRSTVAGATVAGWAGFRESATYDQIDEFARRHPTRFERLVVAAGNVIVDAELELPATGPPDLAIDDIVTAFIADLR